MAVDPSMHAGVARERLYQRLDVGFESGVTLVSAPAGSGKSTLLRSWLVTVPHPVAWVSVGRDGPDTARFCAALVNRLREALGGSAAGESTGPTEPTGRRPDVVEVEVEVQLERIRALLCASARRVVLVVDDLPDPDDLGSAGVHRMLEHLLAVRPRRLSVVLATRHDPPLGLHRLRLSGELSELRAADLSLTPAETEEFLGGWGFTLPAAGVQRLHERTEGWAAGLRLAAMVLSGVADPVTGVDALSGGERTIADYLRAEVLDRQPPAVQELLLGTSVLERVSGPLADALVGTTGAAAVLRGLEQAGVFVVALDAAGTWFRYHRLLAEMLRAELARRRPDAVREQHRRAAAWYAAHGHVDAVHHAQLAGDWTGAVRLLADQSASLAMDGRQQLVHDLLGGIPYDLVETDPELAVVLAADELCYGSLPEAAAFLALAEHHRDRVPEQRRVRFDEALELRRLALARQRGDSDQVHARLPAPVEPGHAPDWGGVRRAKDARAYSLLQLGMVEGWTVSLHDAVQHLGEARELARQSGRPYLEIACRANLASVETRRSFLQAEGPSREIIAAAEAYGWGADPVLAPALATRGIAVMQAGRLEEARSWLSRAEQALRGDTEPALGLLVYSALGTLCLLQGQPERAVTLLRQAGHHDAQLVARHPLSRQLTGALVRALVRSGEVAAARVTLEAVDGPDRLSGEFREAGAVVALAERNPRAALALLGPVLEGAAPVHHPVVVIRGLLVAATAHRLLGNPAAARGAVARALRLAEPDGLVMPFQLDPHRDVLQYLSRSATGDSAFLDRVLDSLAEPAPVSQIPAPAGPTRLSPSELRVLRFLPSNLGSAEIAAELHVSVHTVKTHMRHIYDKLGAHTRSEAVGDGRRLHLLPAATRPDEPVASSR